MREAIFLVLSDKGYYVQAARDGQEATAMFAEMDPDLVVLDIQMPKMIGPDTCAAIRGTSQVPIIMFTSTDDATSVKDAILKGATYFVLKTTGVSELTDRIAYHLDKIDRGKLSKSAPNPKIEVPAIAKTVSVAPKAPNVSTTLIVDPDQASRDAIKAVLHRRSIKILSKPSTPPRPSPLSRNTTPIS